VFPTIWEAVAVPALGSLLAHQGGWDEALMFLVPVAVFVLLLRAASARAQHLERTSSTSETHDDDRVEHR
jgi:predicted MFS family arabinose efflux permease